MSEKKEGVDRFSSYQYGEGVTGIGQVVEFTCPIGATEFVRNLLKSIRTIPITGRVNVAHGTYGRNTRYDVTQHKYAGGGYPGNGGFYEVLEIKNPPDGRWGIVIYEDLSPSGGTFTEWETLQDALNAYERYCNARTGELAKIPGFKRIVLCGELTPWFYAIGNELLVGDYAFPDGLQDDAVFRFGRQFVVFDSDGVPSIKTCMGTRFVKRFYEAYYSSRDSEYEYYRLVYWDDGSVWDEHHSGNMPRPLEEKELWIVEAIQQFKQMLAGKNTEFTINFTNGNKFVGKLVQPESRACAEGRYLITLKVKGKKQKDGFVDFKPTSELPDIVQYVTEQCARNGKEIERLEIKECKTERGGKKWSGVFFSPSK